MFVKICLAEELPQRKFKSWELTGITMKFSGTVFLENSGPDCWQKDSIHERWFFKSSVTNPSPIITPVRESYRNAAPLHLA